MGVEAYVLDRKDCNESMQGLFSAIELCEGKEKEGDNRMNGDALCNLRYCDW